MVVTGLWRLISGAEEDLPPHQCKERRLVQSSSRDRYGLHTTNRDLKMLGVADCWSLLSWRKGLGDNSVVSELLLWWKISQYAPDNWAHSFRYFL